MKKIISFILVLSLFTSILPLQRTKADELEEIIEEVIKEQKSTEEKIDIGQNSLTIPILTTRTVDNVIEQYKFRFKTGHGFAAERGNNLVDKLLGKNVQVVGDNNIKNGPDRVIINRDGTKVFIQDKYCATASDTINACFDNETGMYRYIDSKGNPMKVEVPNDQYDAAVKEMQKKIKAGKVKGVTDPSEAETLVKKGHLTYEQAKNLTKALTPESLAYDSINGVISASAAFGIGTVLDYVILRLGGVERGEAIKKASLEGLMTGGKVFAVSVIAGQLAKTGAIDIFKPTSEALTKALGEDFSKKLLKAFSQEVIAEQGETVAETATKQAAKLLRSQVLVAAVSIVVFSVPDAISMFKGRISKRQFLKNVAIIAASITMGTIGYGIGGAVGGLISSGVGATVGGVIGSLVFGYLGGLGADLLGDLIVPDDAEEMYTILSDNFDELCKDYLISEQEAQEILNELSKKIIDNDFLKDMYQSNDRNKFAIDFLSPIFDAEIQKREKIVIPTEEELRNSLKEQLKGVVFIH